MILAGDVGGTKSLVGLFEPAPRRPVPVEVQSLRTLDFDSLQSLIRAFFDEHPPRAAIRVACFGVAGPVIGESARMTNVPWQVNAGDVKDAFGMRQVRLLNDLESMGYAVPVLEPAELHVLQAGTPRATGNAALIAAGTGLGVSILHRVEGRLRPLPSEGGHADFPARTDRELELVRFLRAEFGRADVEAVVSGMGISNLYRFTHRQAPCTTALAPGEKPDDPARVAGSALAGTCGQCVEALELFIGAYGAAAGNLALLAVATAGVYIGGGIAPRLLGALAKPTFLDAFKAKQPMRALLEQIPVQIILNREAALLGAAVFASEMV